MRRKKIIKWEISQAASDSWHPEIIIEDEDGRMYVVPIPTKIYDSYKELDLSFLNIKEE